MQGYFRKRGDTWSFTVDIGTDPATGKRRQKSLSGFLTKKKAAEACAELIAQLTRGTYVNEKNILVKEFAQDWLKMYAAAGNVKNASIRERTYQSHRLVKYYGEMKLRNVTRKSYQDLLIAMHSDGLAKNTMINSHAAYRMMFRKAVELGLIQIDPTEFAKVPQRKETFEDLETEGKFLKYLEKDELVRFLQATKSGPDITHLAFKTLAYTGMRIGELCVLRWSDIDFTNGTISITKTLYNPADRINHYEINTPKTKSSRRTIGIDAELLAELQSHQAEQNKIRMRYRDRYHDKGFIFARSKPDFPGYPIPRKLIEQRIKKFLAIAKLPTHLSPHSLRHTHTSLLAEAGVSLEAIMERLGHKNDSTTRAIYLHVTKDVKRDAAEKFGALMRNVGKM